MKNALYREIDRDLERNTLTFVYVLVRNNKIKGDTIKERWPQIPPQSQMYSEFSKIVLQIFLTAPVNIKVKKTFQQAYPFEFITQPFHGPIPLPLEIAGRLQQPVSGVAITEQRHHAFDALVGALLVVVLGALDGVKQAISIIRDTWGIVKDREKQR